MTPPAPPGRRRSRTIRAAALVTLGLGVAGCDETPPGDLPDRTESRLDACRAAHRRLGDDPANPRWLKTEPGVGHRFIVN